MTPAEWLVLDNLLNGWHYRTNMDREIAEQALSDLVGRGLVVREEMGRRAPYRLTDAGRIAHLER